MMRNMKTTRVTRELFANSLFQSYFVTLSEYRILSELAGEQLRVDRLAVSFHLIFSFLGHS